MADETNKPILFTQHWFPNHEIASAVKANHSHNVFAVAPTNFMYRANVRLGIPTIDTIPHGIDLDVIYPASRIYF